MPGLADDQVEEKFVPRHSSCNVDILLHAPLLQAVPLTADGVAPLPTPHRSTPMGKGNKTPKKEVKKPKQDKKAPKK